MKKLFWLLLFSGISASLQAQDLIVTRTNDSINCLITKVKSDYIYFTFQEEDRTIKTLLPEKHVKYHQKNFFYSSKIPLGGSSTTRSSQMLYH